MAIKIHMLDPGPRMYGDAIVVEIDGKTVLIDGAHPGDERPGRSTPALQDQIASALGVSLPVELDLLVVTHCHSDHIGCLPELLANGCITTRHALVADELLGFGRPGGTDGITDVSADPLVHRVVAALREEPTAGARTDAELEQLMSDAATLESRYLSMLAGLEADGVKIVRYGRDSDAAVKKLLRSVGIKSLKVLGPTEAQLFLCAEAIRRYTERAVDAVTQELKRDTLLSDVDLYRMMAGRPGVMDLIDAPGKGAALNDQSILIVVGSGPDKCFLTGDMQFAAAEVSSVPPLMNDLREVVKAEGPYAFVKVPHHASYNGLDAGVLADWGCNALGITTGSNDPGHPSSSVLRLLRDNTENLTWARTDKNGLVTVEVENGEATYYLTRGELNDFSANARDAMPEGESSQAVEEALANSQQVIEVAPAPAPRTSVERYETASMVEVTAKIPNRRTRVTITVDIDPEPDAGRQVAQHPAPVHHPVGLANTETVDVGTLGGGRPLPPLLFVTDEGKLSSNIGAPGVTEIRALVQHAGQQWLDVAGLDARQTVPRTAAAGRVQGIVLLGGYDIVPSDRLDTLPPALRSQFVGATSDPDNFIVWSDDAYGDTDGDGAPNLPISRVPDLRSVRFMRRVLTGANGSLSKRRFGLRNAARPFADQVYQCIDGIEAMLESAPTGRGHYKADSIGAPSVYFMLHGSDADGTTFWGEQSGDMLPAIDVTDVPDISGATVFAGCCWGALIVREIASQARGTPTPKTQQESIALTCLAQGARAFVGCTGVHYSPAAGENCLGSPMHHEFWKQVRAGKAPAEALLLAKEAYVAGMFHGLVTRADQAVEYKILRQFTCLGLGW